MSYTCFLPVCVLAFIFVMVSFEEHVFNLGEIQLIWCFFGVLWLEFMSFLNLCFHIFNQLYNFSVIISMNIFLWHKLHTHTHTHTCIHHTHKHTYILDYMLSYRSLRHSSSFTPVFCLSGLQCGQFQLPCLNGHWYCFFHLIYSFSEIFIVGIILTSKSFIFLFPFLFSLLYFSLYIHIF